MRRMVRDLNPQPVLRAPTKLKPPSKWPQSASLKSLDLMPRIKWYTGDRQPLAAGRRRSLTRDSSASSGTSSASTNRQRDQPRHRCHLGPLASSALRRNRPATNLARASAPKGRTSTFLHELIWREFAYHLLYHFPKQRRSRYNRSSPLSLEEERKALESLAARPNRHPARRRRHARAVGHRRHAQPRAHDRRPRSS